MKRFAVLALLPLIFAGCAQIFDANLFEGVDKPPALDASDLADASVDEIASMVEDEAFYEQLREDPDALEAVQEALEEAIIDPLSTSAEVLEAATLFVLVSANGSDAGEVVNDAITEAINLSSGGDPADAITALFDGKSEAEITDLLQQFMNISAAMNVMQTAAASGATVESDALFAEASNPGEIAQIALVAAAVSALVTDYNTDGNTLADLAADLAAGNAPSTVSTTAMTELTDALGGDNNTSNPYAYVAAALGILPL